MNIFKFSEILKKYIFLICYIVLIFLNQLILAQTRKEINIPDIPGYLTLKCDFHSHTLFSDGEVWPTYRIKEAWKEGLDVLSLTDHIDTYHNSKDINFDNNRPFEIAKSVADEYGIILIKGAEITKDAPFGHMNALFLNDIKPLENPDYREDLKAAMSQKAFIFWNHPCWNTPDCKWTSTQEEIYKNGMMHGIEVINTNDYYKEAFKWALEKNLTILCNSDTHGPIEFEYDKDLNEHRPITLVFSKDKNINAIKDALFSRRTAAYYKNIILGKEEFLKPLFYNSISLKENEVVAKRNNNFSIQIFNSSDIGYELIPNDSNELFNLPKTHTLYPHKTTMLEISKKENISKVENDLLIPFLVKNMLIKPDKSLPIEIKIKVFSVGRISLKDDKSNPGHFKLQVNDLPDNMKVYYSLDGSDPSEISSNISKPFKTENGKTLKLVFYKNNHQIGDIIEKQIYISKATGKNVSLKNSYKPKYSAGGENALVDGFTGSLEFNDGNWQGFESDDLDAIINLEKKIEINKIKINFLQDLNSWIFPPKEVDIYYSIDGNNYSKIYNKTFNSPDPNSSKSLIKFECDVKRIEAKFLHIVVKNTGICPTWHKGAGGKAWIFTDEIIIE